MRNIRCLYALLVVLILVPQVVRTAFAGQPAVRNVRGQVIAVIVNETPQVIVVKTMIVGKKEMIVGATVDSGASITRRMDRVALSDIKVGETVELEYIKNPDGLITKSVHAR